LILTHKILYLKTEKLKSLKACGGKGFEGFFNLRKICRRADKKTLDFWCSIDIMYLSLEFSKNKLFV
jgi:hypothetical protein